MPAKSFLYTRTKGLTVLAEVSGKPTLWPHSNVGKAIARLGLTPEHRGVSWELIMGGKRQHRPDGYHMAIVLIDEHFTDTEYAFKEGFNYALSTKNSNCTSR